MPAAPAAHPVAFDHRWLPCGVELAADVLPDRPVAALSFRMLSGSIDEPADLLGIGAVVERTLSKGTQQYAGRALADAFDMIGAQWSTTSGRQSMLLRIVCLPEFVLPAVDLAAEMLCRPTFPDDACHVAVKLAAEQLKLMEDDPQDLVRVMSHKLTLGPLYGRQVLGEPETLPRITPELVREHWRRVYQRGRLQVTAAGRVDADALAARVEAAFATLGEAARAGRSPADFETTARRAHRPKELAQQYIMITLPGLDRGHAHFAREQVLLGVLSGGMSGRLFTEVREKRGLVYWVAAWHEQPRGRGVINLGASTTPERCQQTHDTLMRELGRIGEDLAPEEVSRAAHSLIAHAQTEDDLTRARAGGLSDDLFHFSRPIGLEAKLDAIRRVTLDEVAAYARSLALDRVCVATLGPKEL